MVSVVALALLASVAMGPATPNGAAVSALPHPIHSTLTELVEDRGRGALRLTIRVFADDFGVALTRASAVAIPTAGPGWEAAAARYAASVVEVRDARGRTLVLRPCGIRRTSGVLWLCLEAALVGSTQGLQLRDAMLCELYDDQVNVVQGVIGGARRSMLFVRGDGYKPLH
jgi:hypothetical protein